MKLTLSDSGSIARGEDGFLVTAVRGWPFAKPELAEIVRRVNLHDELVAALVELNSWVKNWNPDFVLAEGWDETNAKVKAALDKAKEGAQ